MCVFSCTCPVEVDFRLDVCTSLTVSSVEVKCGVYASLSLPILTTEVVREDSFRESLPPL